MQQDRRIAGPGAPASPELWRRTTVELGPLRITREYHLAAARYPMNASARTVGRGGWRVAGLAAVLGLASIGGLAVAATKTAQPATYSITVPVPERHAEPRALESPRATGATRPRHTADLPLPDTQPDATTGITADTATTSRAAAIAAAFTTGEMQEWQSGDGVEHGYVVAGEAERHDGTTCRPLSVLVRPVAGGDHVEQLRECRAGGQG